MIGLDTNVILRFLLKDDPVQLAQVRALFRSFTSEQPGWIGIATLLEVEWVLAGSKSRMNRETIANALAALLPLDSVVVEHSAAVSQAIQQYRQGKAEFTDCLIAASARAAGCSEVVTFDRIAARDAGMTLIESLPK
jgi:predicted nucleic-acid-binding protein